ncbi:hypothetical protein ACJX0J_025140, partial [Zea mays]
MRVQEEETHRKRDGNVEKAFEWDAGNNGGGWHGQMSFAYTTDYILYNVKCFQNQSFNYYLTFISEVIFVHF